MFSTKKLAGGLLIILVAAAIGRFTAPAKVVEKTVVQYKDKIVVKKVFIAAKDTKKNVVTIRITTVKPDGTRTTETRRYDRSEIELTQRENTDLVEDKTGNTTTEKTTEYSRDNTLISLATRIDTDAGGQTYGLFINRRVLGPIYLGAFGFTDRSFGLSGGLSF